MSDALFELYCKVRDRKILDGYVREISLQIQNTVSEDIINILLQYFFLIFESFMYYNDKHYKLSDSCMTITKSMNFAHSTVYGNINIPSHLKLNHKWTFKIHEMAYPDSIGIAIDEISRIRRNAGTPSSSDKHGKSKLYGIWSDGELTRWNTSHEIIGYDTFKQGDTVIIKLNLIKGRISMRVNNGIERVKFSFIKMNKNISYCLGVCCLHEGDCVELKSYSYSV